MPPAEQFEILVVGSGTGGRLLARDMAQWGRRTAVVERQRIGGACHTVACLPSKNEIWSARVAHFVRNAAQFGLTTGPVTTRATFLLCVAAPVTRFCCPDWTHRKAPA